MWIENIYNLIPVIIYILFIVESFTEDILYC